jgi:predicted DNA-binding transcriptional regulator YafY
MHPLERLINLLALLLEARRPLSFDEIRETMPEAYGHADEASAKRMFERDKDVLREVGVPMEVVPTDPWNQETGYRVPKDQYYLPEITFTPEEVWALFAAAHAPGEAGEAGRAFWKLATGVDSDVLAMIAERAPAPGLDASGPHLGSIADALARRRRVRFRYRSAQGRVGRREVDPYALLFRGGNWYLIGRDQARDDVRAFRLSRLGGPVKDAGEARPAPEGFEAAKHVQAGPWGLGEPQATARVAFSPKVAPWAVPSTTGARPMGTTPDGWVEVEVPSGGTDPFVAWVLSFGPDARLVAPRSLRDEVVARLRSVLADA